VTGPARCQLYLAAPAVLPPGFAGQLAAVLDAAPVACLRLPASPEAETLVPLAQARDCAVVIDRDVALAAAWGADGVHLADLHDYPATRGRLGPQAIVGVDCDLSRHLAMEAGEAGADYVALGANLELVRWWAELMVVPVVVELAGALGHAGEFIAAGADFIAAGEALWTDPEGAVAAVRRLDAILL
jgi:thiamine-phosphate pyrophosphorylase